MRNRTAAASLAAIRTRPCPAWCARPGHRYTGTRRIPWDLDRLHPVAFPLNGRRAVVEAASYDEFAVGYMRGPDVPDEDWVGEPFIFCDQRFLLDGAKATETRRMAARVQILADQLRAAADRLDEIARGGR